MSRRWPVPPRRLLDGRRVGAVSSAAATYGRPTLHYAMDVLTYVSTYVVRTYVRKRISSPSSSHSFHPPPHPHRPQPLAICTALAPALAPTTPPRALGHLHRASPLTRVAT